MLQTYSPKLFSKAAPESCSPKLLPKTAPQNCVLKLLPKGTPHSKLLFKAAPPQSCSEQLLSLPRKVISESGFPKLLSKAIPQSYRFSKQLSVNAAFKAAKLLPAVIPQSCSSKLLPKAASEKRSLKLQCYYPKLPQSWSGRLSKVAPQSFFFGPSPLPFGGSTVLRLTRGPAGNRTTTGSLSAPYQLSHEDTYKVAPQSCCPKLFPGAAPQSCAPKLFSKAAILQTCSPKRLPKAILQSGS